MGTVMAMVMGTGMVTVTDNTKKTKSRMGC